MEFVLLPEDVGNAREEDSRIITKSRAFADGLTGVSGCRPGGFGLRTIVAACVPTGVVLFPLPAALAAATPLVTVTVPEVGCLSSPATTGGLVRPTVPARAHLRVPQAEVRALEHLSLFVSGASGPNNTVVPGLRLLAPRSWYCAGTEGVDGNASLTAVPVSQACTGRPDGTCEQFSKSASLKPQSVTLLFRDLGGMTSSLCRWPHFAKTFCAIAAVGKPVAYPGEIVNVLGRWSIDYEDPPGVHGHGQASGGWDPDNGVVTYVPPPPSWKVDGTTYKAGPVGSRRYLDEGVAYQGDCTLPASQHTWCTAILNDVLDSARP